MKKISIGIDIDTTVYETVDEMLNFIGLYYNEMFNRNQITNGLEDLPGVEESVIRDAIDLAVANENSPIYKNAKEVINWLSERFNIYFLTYRSPEFLIETINLLNKLDVEYYLYLTTRNKGKHNLIYDKDIKFYIEDDAETIEEVADRTDCITLIYDQPWNRNVVQDFNKIRVYNWNEVKEFFIIEGQSIYDRCEFYPLTDAVCDCGSDISGVVCTREDGEKCQWAKERRNSGNFL